MPLSRRSLLTMAPCVLTSALLGTRQGLAAAHFWDSRPSSQWTPEQIAELCGGSPWAKQVVALYRAAMEDLQPRREGQPTQGRGEATVGECGLVPCGTVMPGKVTVIWESAQPIREALGPVIPPEFNGRYVISIRGLESAQTADQFKAATDLAAKGKSPIQPGIVGRRNNTWLFGFSKELLPLDAGDKDVQFTVHTGARFTQTLLRATFSPKEMMYRGALAL